MLFASFADQFTLVVFGVLFITALALRSFSRMFSSTGDPMDGMKNIGGAVFRQYSSDGNPTTGLANVLRRVLKV